MRSERRRVLLAAGALLAGFVMPVHAAPPLELQQSGTLRIAVYAGFPPYSNQGKGVDVAIGQALAERLGLRAEIVEFPADEDMNDDLRNMVWRGHYLGTRPADVMMHVPVDAHLARSNDKVAIFGPYHLESMALARNPARVPSMAGSAASAFDIFTQEKVGVELDTHASDFMLHVQEGRLRESVSHYRSLTLAVEAMRQGDVAAVMGTRTELEAALDGNPDFVIDTLQMPELRVNSWPIGMAVKAEHTELAGALAGALQELQRSGQLGRIFADHGITHRTTAKE